MKCQISYRFNFSKKVECLKKNFKFTICRTVFWNCFNSKIFTYIDLFKNWNLSKSLQPATITPMKKPSKCFLWFWNLLNYLQRILINEKSHLEFPVRGLQVRRSSFRVFEMDFDFKSKWTSILWTAVTKTKRQFKNLWLLEPTHPTDEKNDGKNKIGKISNNFKIWNTHKRNEKKSLKKSWKISDYKFQKSLIGKFVYILRKKKQNMSIRETEKFR